MKIAICGAMAFKSQMLEAQEVLAKDGHTAYLPDMAETDYTGMTEAEISEKKTAYIWYYIGVIEQSDAILVLNHHRKGFDGYIGANTFLEMVIAMYRRMPIYVINPLNSELGNYEEIAGMKPVILNGNLENLK